MDKKKKEETPKPKDWYVEFLKSQGVIVNKKGNIVAVPPDSKYSREYDY